MDYFPGVAFVNLSPRNAAFIEKKLILNFVAFVWVYP